jgi:hypothetical protein
MLIVVGNVGKKTSAFIQVNSLVAVAEECIRSYY